MTAKAKQPFLPLFFGDFLGATALWEGEEQGLYLLLMGYQWSAGSLPSDPKRLCRMVRYDQKEFDRLWKIVGKKFIEVDGRLFNERLEEHRSKTQKLQDKNSQSGRLGASKKWGESTGEMSSETPGETRSKRLASARRLAMHSDDEWISLLNFCGNSCVKCGSKNMLCKDHIIPIYQGGSDGIENLQPLCKRCNSSKGADRTDYRKNAWRNAWRKCLKTPGDSLAIHPIPSHPNPNYELTDTSSHPESYQAAQRNLSADDVGEEPRLVETSNSQEEGKSPSVDSIAIDSDKTKSHTQGVQRGSRISQPFEITAEMISWAQENSIAIDLDAATKEFVDYWIGVPGTRGRKLDWVATWRNRMREIQAREQKFKRFTPESRAEQRKKQNISASQQWLRDEELKDAQRRS